MPKYRVSELEGTLLDAAVANANGWESDARAEWWRCDPGNAQARVAWFKPSTDWDVGGPFIEREAIGLNWLGLDRGWFAVVCRPPGPGVADGIGATPLIAAMRAYVASKLGDEVELP